MVKRSYCLNDLKTDYNSYRGNAYGLANTLMQTGPLRPQMKSRKVKDLYFAGQLTVPGPGVPPALISGHTLFPYTTLFRFSEERRVGKECTSRRP